MHEADIERIFENVSPADQEALKAKNAKEARADKPAPPAYWWDNTAENDQAEMS